MRPPRAPRLPRPRHTNPGVDSDATAATRGYAELIQLTLLALAFVLAASGCAQRTADHPFRAGGEFGDARYTPRRAVDQPLATTPQPAPAAAVQAPQAAPIGPDLSGAPGPDDTRSAGTAARETTDGNNNGPDSTPAGDLINTTAPDDGSGQRPLQPGIGSGPSPFDPPADPTPGDEVAVASKGLLQPAAKPTDRHVIVIDPGHGGKDPGTSGNGMTEKIIILPLALRVATLLRSRGFTVVCTRTDDSYPSLEDRVELAKRHKAFVFLSVHANAFVRTTTRGVETVYPAKGRHAAASEALGKLVQTELVATCPTLDRRAKADVRNLYILRNAPCATAIAEIGFLTNKEDAAYIADDAKRSEIAVALANGVIRYFNSRVK